MRPAAGQQDAAAGMPARQAATQDAEQVLARLGSTRAGLFDPADRGALTPVRHNGAHDW
ncbi:hypothetical protein ACIHEI_17860 [Kitasatospora sp. NPDC051984]|uniref:hypothetical protein n=1 Tax=Kitasatospora sp. NPDC051984 TaxID=3364059 RepID=UPI0037C542CF